MTDTMPKNGPYEPATDEQIEFWQVQVDYGAKIVVGPIARDALGGILARLAASENALEDAKQVLRKALDVQANACHLISKAIPDADLWPEIADAADVVEAEAERILGRKP